MENYLKIVTDVDWLASYVSSNTCLFPNPNKTTSKALSRRKLLVHHNTPHFCLHVTTHHANPINFSTPIILNPIIIIIIIKLMSI